MESGEPTLVPEWLRCTGGGPGVGGSGHTLTSSSAHSDSSSVSRGRNRNSKTTAFDSSRSAYFDRSSSSNSRRSSSNGSAKNAYSSFSRSHRDNDWDRDKDRSKFGGDHWDRDSPGPLGRILTNWSNRDTLQRSHSMVTRKHVDILAQEDRVDLKNGISSNHVNGNGLISGGTLQKVVLDKDFPLLGVEEKQGVPDVVRVSSPGLSTATQNLPVGSSALPAGEGWTSALAEVPNIMGNSCSVSLPGIQVTSAATATASGTSSAMAVVNMAEALTLAPPRARATPQLSVQTQRREELAIKQCRQLIPVTPSMPKGSVLNSSEKSKPKSLVRSGEVTMASKNLQQQPSSVPLVSFGGAKADAAKTPQGKLFVLKLGLENGMPQSLKDSGSPTNNISRATNSQPAAPSVPSTALRSPTVLKPSSGERKPSALALMTGFSLEKKPSLSQTQSRNDFFTLLKKKNSANASSAPPESTSVASSLSSASPFDLNKDKAHASPQAVKECADLTDNGEHCEEVNNFSEEEVAFLHSLGWEENTGEEEGLTEEEINAFWEECMKLAPSVKLCSGVQQRLLESRGNSLNGVSSELCSSHSGLEA